MWSEICGPGHAGLISTLVCLQQHGRGRHQHSLLQLHLSSELLENDRQHRRCGGTSGRLTKTIKQSRRSTSCRWWRDQELTSATTCQKWGHDKLSVVKTDPNYSVWELTVASWIYQHDDELNSSSEPFRTDQMITSFSPSPLLSKQRCRLPPTCHMVHLPVLIQIRENVNMEIGSRIHLLIKTTQKRLFFLKIPCFFSDRKTN